MDRGRASGRILSIEQTTPDVPNELSVSTLKTEAGTPDPERHATVVSLGILLVALVMSLVVSDNRWSSAPFKPALAQQANFAAFASFYIAAQLVERLLEPVAPIFPWWNTRSVEQARADRAQIMLGIAALAGAVASFAFGLYFLRSVGISAPRWADIFFSGLTIGGGTKALHDLLSSVQKAATPKHG